MSHAISKFPIKNSNKILNTIQYYNIIDKAVFYIRQALKHHYGHKYLKVPAPKMWKFAAFLVLDCRSQKKKSATAHIATLINYVLWMLAFNVGECSSRVVPSCGFCHISTRREVDAPRSGFLPYFGPLFTQSTKKTIHLHLAGKSVIYSNKSEAFLSSQVKLTTMWRHLTASTKVNIRIDNAAHKGSTEMRLSGILASTHKEMGVLRHFIATKPNGQHQLCANENLFHYTKSLLWTVIQSIYCQL